MDAGVLAGALAQIAISAVLLSLILGAVAIPLNGRIAGRLAGAAEAVPPPQELAANVGRQVRVLGYGRVGHTIAMLLDASGIPFLAVDARPTRVAVGREAGHPLYYGNLADPTLLPALALSRAALAVVTMDDPAVALRLVAELKRLRPDLPVIARARDLESGSRLRAAGATHAHPDTIEASLHLAARALETLNVPAVNINSVLEDLRDRHYGPVTERETPG